MARAPGNLITDWYWIVNDTTPTTNVYSTATNSYVANNAAAYLTWLTDGYVADGIVIQPAWGTAAYASALADNGLGKVRVTLQSTASFQTGQRFRFANSTGTPLLNGNQQITVVDATHIDVTAITFVATDATTVMLGPSIIDTAANLATVVNNYNIGAAVPNSNVFTGSASYVLTNPLGSRISISPSAGGTVQLPLMNAPNSIPIGTQVEIRNDGAFFFTLRDSAGVSLVNVMSPNTAVDIVLVSNATAAGTFLITTKTINIPHSFIGVVSGLRAVNNTATPLTKLDVTAASWQSGVGSRPAFAQYPNFGTPATVDAGLAGPVVNGRDQAAAFTASQWLHVWAIGKNSELGDNVMRCTISSSSSNPTMPTGYQYYAYLFSVYWNAASNLLSVTGRGNLVTYNASQVALSAGAASGATPTTAVSLAILVPPNASNVNIKTIGLAGGGGAFALNIGAVSGSTMLSLNANASQYGNSAALLPNVSQNLYYNNTGPGAPGGAAYIDVMGYTVPNGG